MFPVCFTLDCTTTLPVNTDISVTTSASRILHVAIPLKGRASERRGVNGEGTIKGGVQLSPNGAIGAVGYQIELRVNRGFGEDYVDVAIGGSCFDVKGTTGLILGQGQQSDVGLDGSAGEVQALSIVSVGEWATNLRVCAGEEDV